MQFTVITPDDRRTLALLQVDWIEERFGWDDLDFLVMIPATANAGRFLDYLGRIDGRNWEAFMIHGFPVGWFAAFKH